MWLVLSNAIIASDETTNTGVLLLSKITYRPVPRYDSIVLFKAGVSNSFQFQGHFRHILSEAGRTSEIIA